MDRVALVTGGTKGIGLSCVERFLRDGWKVGFCARSADEVEATQRRLGSNVHGMVADMGKVEDCLAIVPGTVSAFGRLDALVNNAGVYAPVPFVDFTADDWDSLTDINVRGPVLAGGSAARQMISQGGGGRIVNIASTNGILSEAQFAHYNSSKAALITLTKTMAIELGPHGILVNAVAPGWILTPLSEPFVKDLPQDSLDRMFPLQRVGTSDEIAGAVAFFCGPDSTYVTGTTLVVDGGCTVAHPAV
mgnify:CR=1 FL=1